MAMARLDTSRAGELRVLAEKLRRHARDMTLHKYVEMMEHAAAELEAEAGALEQTLPAPPPGRRLNIII